MADTTPIEDRYNTYAELGAAVKLNNPQLTKDDADVGRWYASRHNILVTEPPTGSKHPMNAFMDATKQMVETIATPFEAASNVAGEVDSWTQDVGEGVASGISLGATERLRDFMGSGSQGGVPIPTAEERSPLGYATGEMIGEVMGPYQWAGKLLGMFAGAAKAAHTLPMVAKKALAGQRTLMPNLNRFGPRVSMAAKIGGEAGIVEGSKAALQTQDVSDAFINMATAVALGPIVPAIAHSTGVGYKGLVEKWLHPRPGEMDTGLLAFMDKWEIPRLVGQLRPSSPLVQATMRRLSATATTAREMMAMRSALEDGLESMQRNVVARLGDNAAVLPPTAAGKAIYEEMKGLRTFLKKQSKDAYDELRKTTVGQTRIRPNMDVTFERLGDEGVVTTSSGSIFGELKKLVGQSSALASGPRKKIRKFYRDLLKFHKPAEGSTEVPLKTYDWWWEELQQVGEMMDSPKIQENRADMRLVKRVYHIVQDVIDAHAKAVSAEFDAAINQARKIHIESLTYAENPRLQAVMKLTEDTPGVTDYSSVIGRLFSNADGVRDAKRLLGPEGFNQARQAWVRDLFWDSMETKLGGETYISGRKFMTNIAKQPGGMKGEFMEEMFTDRNFYDTKAEPLQVNTYAAEKLAMMKEVFEQMPKLEPAMSQLMSKGEQMQQQMAEKVSPAQFIQGDPKPATVAMKVFDTVKELMLNLVLFRKTSRIVFNQNMATNPFLGGPVRTFGTGGMPMGGSMVLPQEQMYRATSSAINQLRENK